MFSNRKVRWLFACALILAPLAFGVEERIQTQGQTMAEKAKSFMETGAALARGTAVIGHDVHNAQGEKIGTIKDVVLDERGDKIIYAALAHGGVAGVGSKLSAVPWSEYRITPVAMEQPGKPSTAGLMGSKDQKFTITLNVSKDVLGKINGFKETEWPAQAEMNWQHAQPAKTETIHGKSLRLSKLIGQEVNSEHSLAKPEMGKEAAASSRIGELKDVALATRVGRPVYGEITLANIKGKEDFHSIVPWSAVKFELVEKDRIRVALNVPDTQTLEAFAFKSDSEMPQLAERNYAKRLYTAYNQQPDFEMLGFVSPEQGKIPPAREPVKTEPQNY